MTPPTNEPVPFTSRAATAIDIQVLIDVAVERAIDRLLASRLDRIVPDNPIIRSIDHNQTNGGCSATPALGPVRTNPPSNSTASLWGAWSKGPETTAPGPPLGGDQGGGDQATRTAPPQPNRTVTVPEAARILGISRSHAYDLVHRSELAGVRLGRRVIVPISAIDKMLASDSNEAN